MGIQGAESAVGKTASQDVQEQIREVVIKSAKQWEDTFEIETVTAIQEGEGYEVQIGIDVIEEEKVTAELLIDVQQIIKTALLNCGLEIHEVNMVWEDDTHSVSLTALTSEFFALERKNSARSY